MAPSGERGSAGDMKAQWASIRKARANRKPSRMNRKEPMPQMAARMPIILSLRVCGFIKIKLQRGYIALIKYADGHN